MSAGEIEHYTLANTGEVRAAVRVLHDTDQGDLADEVIRNAGQWVPNGKGGLFRRAEITGELRDKTLEALAAAHSGQLALHESYMPIIETILAREATDGQVEIRQ